MTSPLTCEEFPPQVSCCGPLSSFLETFVERHRCWQLGWKVSGERRGRRRSDGAPVPSARWPEIVSLGGGGIRHGGADASAGTTRCAHDTPEEAESCFCASSRVAVGWRVEGV